MNKISIRFNIGERLDAIKGAFFSLLFLASEALGLIILTKFLARQGFESIAGDVSYQLYVVGLINVFFTALSILLIREVASKYSADRDFLQKISSIDSAPPVFILVSIGLIVFFLVQIALQGFFHWVNLIFSLGILLRGGNIALAAVEVGKGRVGLDKEIQFFNSFLFYSLSCLVIYYAPSAVGIAICYLIPPLLVISWQVARWEWVAKIKFVFEIQKIEFAYVKLLILSLGGYFTMNGDAFLAREIVSSSDFAYYSILSKIGVGIFSLAVVYPSMRMQPIARALGNGDIRAAKKLWKECVAVAALIAVSISLVLIAVYYFFGNIIIPISARVDIFTFSMICMNAVIAAFIGANGWPILASSKNSLLLPTWVNAILIGMLGYVGAKNFGIEGMLAGVTLAHITSAVMHFLIATSIFNEKSS